MIQIPFVIVGAAVGGLISYLMNKEDDMSHKERIKENRTKVPDAVEEVEEVEEVEKPVNVNEEIKPPEKTEEIESDEKE